MNYKVKKLDSRYNGYPYFSHMIQPNRSMSSAPYTVLWERQNEFITMREWFWTTFGPSRELKFYRADSEHNLRIYVKEKELHWFLLKWAQ